MLTGLCCLAALLGGEGVGVCGLFRQGRLRPPMLLSPQSSDLSVIYIHRPLPPQVHSFNDFTGVSQGFSTKRGVVLV